MDRLRAPAVRRALREIVLVAALFLAYKLGRLLVEGHVSEAFTNARTVWDLERLVHLPSEAALQAAALHHTGLVRAANSFYAYVHFPATAATLIWLYLRRPAIYLWFRRTLASLTALALVTHALFPLAPGRMVAGTGLIDTGQVYGPSVYGSPSTDTLSNQYAAMPSLHVGWALAVAIALIAASRSRWRWLWLAHPITTLLVVVVTGNHYWLDAIAAVTLLGLVLAVVTPLSRPAATEPAATPVLAPAPATLALPAPALPSAGVPASVLTAHRLLHRYAPLAVLVPGAPLTALVGYTPAPAAVPDERPDPGAQPMTVAVAPADPGARRAAPALTRASPRSTPPDAAVCVPRERVDGEALSRPPSTARPGPGAPRSRSAPHR
jgi:PAP2 superfamily protein